MSKTGALLSFDIVLNINKQVNPLVIFFRLSGWAGPSGNPSGNCFLRIIGAQSFHAGKSLLTGIAAGHILSSLDFISLVLQAAD